MHSARVAAEGQLGPSPSLHEPFSISYFLSLSLSLASSASDCVSSFPSTLVAPDHVGELLVGGVEPVVAHHAPQLAHRDLAVVVGVEERERLLQAVQLLTMTMAAGQRGLC